MTRSSPPPRLLESPSESEVDKWFDEEELEPEIVSPPQKSVEEKYAESQLRVVRTNMDFSLHTLKQNAVDNNWINRAPDYQRRHRWDDKKRSQLIESILMNIPIPPLFLYENEYNQYEVMDGRQRLDTVIDFLDNHFPLKGLEFWQELDGKRFNALSPIIQRGLLRRTLSAIVLLAETIKSTGADDSDIRMIMFRRLNTGGAMLNPQELRNALYVGNFSSALRDLARDDTFTRIWGIPQFRADERSAPTLELVKNPLYKTMADCELVLRFFAIRETISGGLTGSLRKILDDCMERHKSDSEVQVETLKTDYLVCLQSLDLIFDNKPFRLPEGRMSRPLYDALMVARSLGNYDDLQARKSAIQAKLVSALADEGQYAILIGRGNTVDAIRDRVNLAKDILSAR